MAIKTKPVCLLNQTNDFLAQIQQMKHMKHMKQMGGLSSLMDKLPAAMAAKAGDMDMGRVEKDINRKEGMIHSMPLLKRRKPEIIKCAVPKDQRLLAPPPQTPAALANLKLQRCRFAA